jgi:PAS domain S-box-containing protein
MRVTDKTTAQLLKELTVLRQRVAQLEALEAERKHTDEALRQSNERYCTLIETIPHGIEEMDASGIITIANVAHHRQYEYGEGELIGTSILDLVATDSDREELRNYFRYLVKEQPLPVPYFGKKRTKKGTLYY